MEIIKPGNLDKKDGVITFTCPNCDCVFTAKSGEYKHESYQWDCSDFYRVRCPFCGQSITEDAALVYIEQGKGISQFPGYRKANGMICENGMRCENGEGD